MNKKLERIIFGKKFLVRTPEEQFIKLKKQFYILLIAITLLFSCFLYLYLSYPGNFFELSKDSHKIYDLGIHITYQNLSDKQIIHFESIFREINDLYLIKNPNIIVTSEIIEEKEFSSVVGINYGDGNKIKLTYYENEDIMKEIICHELLHSYIYGETRTKYLHDIVYDLGKKQVCFD